MPGACSPTTISLSGLTPTDTRGRSVHEHMVHQCVSEDIWFRTMLGIDVGAPPLPKEEVRLEFMRRYAEDSEKRLAALRDKDEAWWEGETAFFDVQRLAGLGGDPPHDPYRPS